MEIKKLILLLLVMLALAAATLLPGYSRLERLREENRRYEARIKELSTVNEELADELQRLKEDPDYIEKKARDKLGIIKEGEMLYFPE